MTMVTLSLDGAHGRVGEEVLLQTASSTIRMVPVTRLRDVTGSTRSPSGSREEVAEIAQVSVVVATADQTPTASARCWARLTCGTSEDGAAGSH